MDSLEIKDHSNVKMETESCLLLSGNFFKSVQISLQCELGFRMNLNSSNSEKCTDYWTIPRDHSQLMPSCSLVPQHVSSSILVNVHFIAMLFMNFTGNARFLFPFNRLSDCSVCKKSNTKLNSLGHEKCSVIQQSFKAKSSNN